MSRGYRTLRLLGLSIAVLGAIYLFIHSILIPDIDRYISLKERYAASTAAERDLRQSLEAARERLGALEGYEPFLEGLSGPMEPGELKKLLQNYFLEVELEPAGSLKEGDLEVRRYGVRVKMEGTRPFFAFLEDIKKRGYPLEVELPLRMQKEGERISASFGLWLLSAR